MKVVIMAALQLLISKVNRFFYNLGVAAANPRNQHVAKEYLVTYTGILIFSSLILAFITHFALMGMGYTVVSYAAYVPSLLWFSIKTEALSSAIITGVIALVDLWKYRNYSTVKSDYAFSWA
jgi:hypothetical protein